MKIGNQIGAGKEERAKEYGIKFAVIAFVTGITLGVLVISFISIILKLFNVSEVVNEYSKTMLKIYAMLYPIRVVNLVLIVGAFRGGGDAGFALKLKAL